MYIFIKNRIKRLIPNALLIKNEAIFRKMVGLFYSGNRHFCTTCEGRLRKFAVLENKDLLCPKCGSISRNRRLYQLLLDEYIQPNIAILDFSPSRVLYRKMKKIPNIHYTSTDFENEFLADKKLDITQIDCDTASFDLVICYHILEHITQDSTAMKELYRVLKNEGTLLIQTPFRKGEILENYDIITPEDRLKHFGQKDHVRIYSVEGLKKRLESVGFMVKIRKEEKNEFLGLQNETILVARK